MLLPDPDGPITAVKLPRRKPAVTASRARTVVRPVRYSFDTDSRRTTQDWSAITLMPSDARAGGHPDRYPVLPDPSYSWL
ncbi:hypothetical protein GCM10023107_85730 [Actinoplanes octamycinicus]|nr:hypothetical protein Aoc01nite_72130 [Actinoplanes octamycinicus]